MEENEVNGLVRTDTDETGSKDGDGAGDHDVPFGGFRPNQFSIREMSRLLILRGQVMDAKMGWGPFVDDLVRA
jgi:hypothetical protein